MTQQQTNAFEFTVSEISQAVKRTVEDQFGYVKVRGEISGFRGQHSSGHCYFTLKDDAASIDAVVWKGSYSRLAFKPQEGLEIVATGRLTTYPRSSKYQLVIEQIEPAGVGALMALLEERRKMLLAEGLFAAERKRPLPYLPRVIGVVTSPTGAVIRDIIHRLEDRFPTHVIVWPVRVQGETSGAEVTAAIDGFNGFACGGPIPRPDLLIVARGGGSIEDLWGFNEESVVRAVARSEIPVISAVGHETDTTLIDYVADRRAPTPTGAAEMAVPVRGELIAYVDDLGSRQRQGARRLAANLKDRLRAAAAGLPRGTDLVSIQRQRLDMATAHLGSGLREANHIKARDFERIAGPLTVSLLRQRLDGAANRLEAAATRTRHALQTRAGRARVAYSPLAGRLRPGLLTMPIGQGRRHLDATVNRMEPAFIRMVETRRTRFDGLSKLLNSVSYHEILARGFALVTDAQGNLVRSATDVKPGDALTVDLANGSIAATVAGAPPASKRRSRTDEDPGSQESLF